MHTYRIAYTTISGAWDIVEEFDAASDKAANAYAEREYAGQDWYVLDKSNRNINA